MPHADMLKQTVRIAHQRDILETIDLIDPTIPDRREARKIESIYIYLELFIWSYFSIDPISGIWSQDVCYLGYGPSANCYVRNSGSARGTIDSGVMYGHSISVQELSETRTFIRSLVFKELALSLPYRIP